MHYRRFASAIAASAALIALSVPSTAAARAGDRTFQQTFPLASQICAKVAAGTERSHRLRRFAPQVLADCAALQATFTTAQATVLAARGALEPAIAADRAALVRSCPSPSDARPACVAARSTIHNLRSQLTQAKKHYYRTIEAARETFWGAIHALPGQRHLQADRRIDINQD